MRPVDWLILGEALVACVVTFLVGYAIGWSVRDGKRRRA